MMVPTDRRSAFPTSAVVFTAAAFILLVIAVALFLEGGWLRARSREHEVKVLEPVNKTVQKALAEQKAELAKGYRWLDYEQGKVGLPIERAMELVVERSPSTVPAEGDEP